MDSYELSIHSFEAVLAHPDALMPSLMQAFLLLPECEVMMLDSTLNDRHWYWYVGSVVKCVAVCLSACL